MGILSAVKAAVTKALTKVAAPAAEAPDVATLKLMEYKAASPCRDRSGSKPQTNKQLNKNRKAAKAARKARKK